MIQFLEGYLKNLSAVQGRQVLRLLSKMRDRGEIRSHEDFNKALSELGKVVQKGELSVRTPLFSFFEGDLIESDALNTFIEKFCLDLEAALEEIERMSNTMKAHHRILNENYFDALEAVISEMEGKVRAYEVLEFRKFSGFQEVLKVYTFDGAMSPPMVDLLDDMTFSLTTDTRGGEDLHFSPPRQGEAGVHLAVEPDHTEHILQFSSMEIRTDSSTPQTELSTATADDTPLKAIDGNTDTSWRHSIFLMEHPDTCRLKIAVGFAGAERINALSITPLADIAMRLYNVTYIDSGGNEIGLPLGVYGSQAVSANMTRHGLLGDVDSGPRDWILNNERVILPLGDITARKVIVTFQQDTGLDGAFFYYDGDLGSWRRDEEIENYLRNGSFSTGSGDVEVPVALGIIDDGGDRLQANFSEYCFGLREISALSREYEQNGYFAPEPFVINRALKTLALHSDIDIPVDGQASIEIVLRKENYDSQDNIVDVETIPLLPYGDDDVNERLFLTTAIASTTINDCGILRFYPDFTQSFSVYADNSLLTLGTHYSISVDGEASWEGTLPPSGTAETPKRCLVKIVNPRTDSIYRVEYSPLVSTMSEGGEVWLNTQKTVRLERYQVYVFSERRAGEVVRSRLGLQIVTRANTLDVRSSPFLRELILLGG